MNTSSNLSQDVANIIRNIPDFPKEGIQFKDITPLLQNPELLERVVNYFAEIYKDKGITAIVGVESRGFLFGVPLALKMGLPFVLTRKAGKLPAETISLTYELEYGTATLEIHKDALDENDNVVVVDDLIATGGTAIACAELLTENFDISKENILMLAVIDLPNLGGSNLIKEQGYKVETLVSY